jgi:hypothetical protein
VIASLVAVVLALGQAVESGDRLSSRDELAALRADATVVTSTPLTPASVLRSMPDVQQQQQQLDATRFDSVTVIALYALLDSAAQRGLPTAPLINRALEGAARKVSGSKIVAVVRAYAVALETARERLGPGTTMDELNAGASALRAGIDGDMLEAVRATRSPGGAVTPLMVLTDIVQRGVPAVTARDAVVSIARLPRSDDALQGLRSTVAKNSIRGPGMAVDALQRYLRGTVPGSNSPSAPATVDRKPIRPPSP